MAKLLFAFAALCLFAYCNADCSALDKLLVKQQWADAYGTGRTRIEFGQSLWRAIFAKAPDSKKLFGRVKGHDINSPDFKAHIARVYGGLDRLISILDDDDSLKADLDHLSHQHKEMKIPASYFDVLRASLAEVLFAKLGHDFHRQAWEDCLTVITSGIQKLL